MVGEPKDHRGLVDSNAPSPFVSRWVGQLAPAIGGLPALDVAMGRGRHTRLLAAAGFCTYGVDLNTDAVREAAGRLRAEGYAVHPWCADLTSYPLPTEHFNLIVVTRYLQRDLFPALAGALVPGGVLLYETFTESQRRHGRGPTSPDHLLKSGELVELAVALEPLSYEEIDSPDAVACLAARRPLKRA